MWPEEIHRELSAAGVRVVGYVPDAGHKRLIELCQADKKMRAVVLTTEEEGIGLAAGAWLGGEKSVLLMQSSGVGNVINVLGMVRECRFPLVTLVTMRGEQGEFNPWQVPMGQAVRPVLEAMGTVVHAPASRRRDRADRERRAAPRLQQLRLGGGADPAARDRHQELPGAGARNEAQRDVVKKLLLKNREDLLVVAGLGSTAWDITAAGDSPLSFPMWGAMGQAAMIGLGLALAQPKRRVLVITGDGEMLMGMGSLATIGVQQPPNLTVVVIDNERYGETGMQETHTAHGVDLAGVARACGFNVVDYKDLARRDPRGRAARTSPPSRSTRKRSRSCCRRAKARCSRRASGAPCSATGDADHQGQTTFFSETWSVPVF